MDEGTLYPPKRALGPPSITFKCSPSTATASSVFIAEGVGVPSNKAAFNKDGVAVAFGKGLLGITASHSAAVGAKMALSNANFFLHSAATLAMVSSRESALRTSALPLLMYVVAFLNPAFVRASCSGPTGSYVAPPIPWKRRR